MGQGDRKDEYEKNEDKSFHFGIEFFFYLENYRTLLQAQKSIFCKRGYLLLRYRENNKSSWEDRSVIHTFSEEYAHGLKLRKGDNKNAS